MARKTITVTFTRETVAEATIEVPEGFDPMSDTYEDVALEWLDGHKDELSFSHDGTDIEVWNIEAPEEGGSPVPASVVRQRWLGDYATEVGEARFDCREALDAIPLCQLPETAGGFHDDGACDFGDDVFRAAVRLHLTDDWDGPFELYVTDEEAYADYYDIRRAKAGLPPAER